jgi:hypothetical protein
MNCYSALLDEVTQVFKILLILFLEEAYFQLLQRQRPPIVLLRLIEEKKRFFVFPHLEGCTVTSPGDHFDKKVPMSFEGILIWNKQLRYPGMMAKGYPTFLQTPVGTKYKQEEG